MLSRVIALTIALAVRPYSFETQQVNKVVIFVHNVSLYLYVFHAVLKADLRGSPPLQKGGKGEGKNVAFPDAFFLEHTGKKSVYGITLKAASLQKATYQGSFWHSQDVSSMLEEDTDEFALGSP